MGKDIPLIFSGAMVRALLEGRKTQTRRIIVPPAPYDVGDDIAIPLATGEIKPRYAVGDRLWVRESVARIDNSAFGKPSYWQYRADTNGTDFPGDWPPETKDDPERPRWKPAIHMPREASRIALPIDDVKVEPVQNISDADAIAEGVFAWRDGWSKKQAAEAFLRGTEAAVETKEGTVAQRLFYLLWTTINGPDAWRKNPFVVAPSFRVIKANIDAPEARAA